MARVKDSFGLNIPVLVQEWSVRGLLAYFCQLPLGGGAGTLMRRGNTAHGCRETREGDRERGGGGGVAN